jgi:hypothetical protein
MARQAFSGPLPTSALYEEWVQAKGYRPVHKKELRASGLERGMYGFRYPIDTEEFNRDWEQPHLKKIKTTTGHVVYVPDNDYENFLGSFTNRPSDPDSKVGQYIDRAFSGRADDLNQIQSFAVRDIEGHKSHIASVEYNATYQLMEVYFQQNEFGYGRDGDIVCYFQVDKGIFWELYRLAEVNDYRTDKNGIPRHLIGIRFWDIVRVRGTVHATRYYGEYVSEGSSTGSSSTVIANNQDEAVKSRLDMTASEKEEDDDKQMYKRMRNRLPKQGMAEFDKAKSASDMKKVLLKYHIIDL